MVLHALTLKLPIKTSLSELPVSLRSGENCPNFRKTSTPPPVVFTVEDFEGKQYINGKCKLLQSYLNNVPH